MTGKPAPELTKAGVFDLRRIKGSRYGLFYLYLPFGVVLAITRFVVFALI